MPVTRARLFKRAIAVSAVALFSLSALPSCSIFGPKGASTVAQGKYFSSGDPEYDEFFIELYQLQVLMESAPRVPESERQSLAQGLSLAPDATPEEVGQDLREEAQALSRTGLHLKLEQHPASDKPETGSAELRSSAHPKDPAAGALIARVETSATKLVRLLGQMKQAQDRLSILDVATGSLSADIDRAFAQAPLGKRSEVAKNLADAQKLIALMKARANDVSATSSVLLETISKAVDTDDGTLSTPDAEAAELGKEGKSSVSEPKKPASKPPARARSASPTRPKSVPSGGTKDFEP